MTLPDDPGPEAGIDEAAAVERTQAGLRAVGLSLGVLAATTAGQVAVLVASGSAALLADVIHNVGDALTAVPIGLAFVLRSRRGEKLAGYGVVVAIAVSGIAAGVIAVGKLVHPDPPDHLVALALAGLIGVAGNAGAARIRSRAGRRLGSAALVADGHHARMDAVVSGGVVLTSILVGLGWTLADPIIALLITAMIGQIAWEAWATVTGG